MKTSALVLVLAAASPAAFAARPMVTDDARIVDANACQVESWVKRNTDTTEAWALPACNPTGNLELTFGGERLGGGGEGFFAQNIAQGKAILRPLEPDSWGAALAVGATRHLVRAVARGWPGGAYIYVPDSKSFDSDRWVAHVNGGVVHRRDVKRNLATWGFGNEIRVRDDLFFIPEMFRNDFGSAFYQAGLRFWVVKDRVQIDTTYGNRMGSNRGERWFSIGLRLLSPPLSR